MTTSNTPAPPRTSRPVQRVTVTIPTQWLEAYVEHHGFDATSYVPASFIVRSLAALGMRSLTQDAPARGRKRPTPPGTPTR